MGNEEGGWLTAKFTVQSLRKEFPRRFKGAVVTIFVQLKEYIFHPKSFDSNIKDCQKAEGMHAKCSVLFLPYLYPQFIKPLEIHARLRTPPEENHPIMPAITDAISAYTCAQEEKE